MLLCKDTKTQNSNFENSVWNQHLLSWKKCRKQLLFGYIFLCFFPESLWTFPEVFKICGYSMRATQMSLPPVSVKNKKVSATLKGVRDLTAATDRLMSRERILNTEWIESKAIRLWISKRSSATPFVCQVGTAPATSAIPEVHTLKYARARIFAHVCWPCWPRTRRGQFQRLVLLMLTTLEKSSEVLDKMAPRFLRALSLISQTIDVFIYENSSNWIHIPAFILYSLASSFHTAR